MLDDTITYALLAALAIALVWAAFTDIKSRRIANWLNGAIALGAPVYWYASGLSLWPDVAIQIGLGILVFAVGSILFAMRQMGGGDVKLLTALALWMTPLVLLKLVIIMALLGGVLTLVVGIRNVMIRRKKEKTRWAVPYGVAISAAGLWTISNLTMNAAAMTAAAQ